MDECCIHYDQVNEQKLLSLSSYESRQTLLEAAKSREDTGLLTDGEYQQLSFHKGCRSRYTLLHESQNNKERNLIDHVIEEALKMQIICFSIESEYFVKQKTNLFME